MFTQLVEELPDRAFFRQLGADLIPNFGLVILARVGSGYHLEHGELRLATRIRELKRIRDVARLCAGEGAGIRSRQRITRKWLQTPFLPSDRGAASPASRRKRRDATPLQRSRLRPGGGHVG